MSRFLTFCRHAVLAVCFIFPTTAQAQTVVSTTTTFDGGTVPYPAGTLNIDGSGTPTLFMLNGATLGGITTLSIGSVQSGALYLSGGSTLTNSGSSEIGTAVGSVGTATISGANSLWTLTMGLHVGFSGTGVLIVQDGGRVQSTAGLLGYNATGVGTATISGASSQWSVTKPLSVGNSGTGVLNVQDGGRVQNSWAYLGNSSTSRGTATITGTGSQWTLTNELYVGNYGTGVLNVGSGGTVVSRTGFLGFFPGSTGTATVSGAGSRWSLTNRLIVGNAGTGVLNVQDGGNVTSLTGYVGADAGSYGTALITGLNSKWSITNGLYLGGTVSTSGGFGSLTVTDGGTVTVGGLIKIWQQGDLHIGNGGTLQTGTLEIMPGGRFTLDAGGTFIGGSFLGSTNLAVSGTFVANGAVPGQVVVGSGGTLKGGTVGNPDGAAAVGAIVVNSGGTLSPGNSVGQLNVSGTDVPGGASITLNAGSNVVFEFKNALGANPGTDWDLLDLGTGILDLGTAGITPGVDQIKLYLDPWLADNSGHGTNNFTPANDYEWLFIKTSHLGNLTGGVGGVTAANIADYFEIIDDAPGQGLYGSGNPFTNAQRPSGTSRFGLAWMTTAQGSGLYITYAAVPEPGSMLLCGIAAGGLYLRRRRSKQSAVCEPPATGSC